MCSKGVLKQPLEKRGVVKKINSVPSKSSTFTVSMSTSLFDPSAPNTFSGEILYDPKNPSQNTLSEGSVLEH